MDAREYFYRRFKLDRREMGCRCTSCGEVQPIRLVGFDRNDMASMFAELGYTKGAEIGVATGKFSEVLCSRNPQLELLCVDPWAKTNRRSQPVAVQLASRQAAEERLKPYKATIVQATSMEAVVDVPENSLDFVYIDADHSEEAVWLDVVEWSKRVRHGGIVAGDDYIRFSHDGGVIKSVNAYVKERGIDQWFVFHAPSSLDFMWVNP